MTRLVGSLSQSVLWLFAVATLVFLIGPLVIIVPESFSPTATLYFPLKGLSLRWYVDLFNGPFWLDAIWVSVRLALASSVLSTMIGLATAFALVRVVSLGKNFIRILVLSPLIVPTVVSAVAFFDVMARLHLIGTFLGLLLAHTIIALPFPVIILENALKAIDPSLEEAAVSLGATPLQAFYKVALPLMVPSILGALLFAFFASWDEVVIVLFVGGALLQTLPVKMFQFLTTEIRPTIAAASTLLIVALLLSILLIELQAILRRKARDAANT